MDIDPQGGPWSRSGSVTLLRNPRSRERSGKRRRESRRAIYAFELSRQAKRGFSLEEPFDCDRGLFGPTQPRKRMRASTSIRNTPNSYTEGIGRLFDIMQKFLAIL